MSDSDPDFDALYNEKQKIYEQVTERISSDFQRLGVKTTKYAVNTGIL